MEDREEERKVTEQDIKYHDRTNNSGIPSSEKREKVDMKEEKSEKEGY
jgi:hypothetical protein